MSRTKAEVRAACDALAKEKTSAWYAVAGEVLTPEENAEVRKLWDTMSGSSSWAGAFLEWMKL